MNHDKKAVRPITFEQPPFPDADERSKNDPMYLISSNDVLRILNAQQSVGRVLDPVKYPPDMPLLTKRDITEELLMDVVNAAAENGWKAAVTAGKQVLLSIEDIGPTKERVNPHQVPEPSFNHERKTVFVPFGARFNVLGILLEGEDLDVGYGIENPRLEGILKIDERLHPLLKQRYVDASGSPYNGFLRQNEGDARKLLLHYRARDMKYSIRGEVQLESGNIILNLSDNVPADNFIGALVSFELRRGTNAQ